MSEESTEAAESAEAAQGAVETEGSPPPWGDDFNPERAWQTITHLRGREKELEGEAKSWKKFQEDEEFRRQQLAGLGYEFEEGEAEQDDDDLDYDEETPKADPRVEKLLEWQSQLEQERGQERFSRDLEKFAGDREVSGRAREWIEIATSRGGNNPKALEQAVKDWFEFEDSLLDQGRRSRPKSPTPPSTPGAGKAGEQEFDRRNASTSQRQAQRQARIAAALEASQQQ